MKFEFNTCTDQTVALANEWAVVFRLDRFYVVTKVHKTLVAHCGTLEGAMDLGHSLLN